MHLALDVTSMSHPLKSQPKHALSRGCGSRRSSRPYPNGRPKGSRNRISETALKALADDFDAHGVAVIEKVRTERPHDYLKIIVAVLPKRMEIEDAFADKPPHKMTDDELEAIIWKTQRQLEAMGVEQPLTQDDLDQAKARRFARGERV
jgi:hypothetical protein